MDTKTILEYWINPFSFIKFGLSEEDLLNDPNPIVFMGGRGTGKTMFLRYCSYNVQKAQIYSVNKKENDVNTSILKVIKSVGFYIRIDGPVLRSFDGFGLTDEKWNIIFIHYFELFVSKLYFSFLQDLVNSNELSEVDLQVSFYEACSNLICGNKSELKSISNIISYIEDRISEVTQYRAEVPLRDTDFAPLRAYSSQTLSFGIPEICRQQISTLHEDFTFVIMIDEYENFLEAQQRTINTLLKFVKKGITFRIGMRLEGFRTFDTISKDDFIKEGRDYRSVIFEETLMRDSGYSNYLKDIANKRLLKVDCFRNSNLTDISKFLGEREDLEQEAKEIVKDNGDKIFEYYKILDTHDRNLLRYESNPLLQALNCLWFKRGSTSAYISQTLNDYLNGNKSEGVEKYRMDYIDKYKLSLMFLIATIYKKDKSYYSFNTFRYLSSGIVGHFIELCRRCFQYAEFENKEKLIAYGEIPKRLQNSAARDLAESELQQTRRIERYGNWLYVFTLNLGAIFREHHRDMNLKYPETNQLSTEKTLLPEPYKGAFEAAQRWSIIQRKSKQQQRSIGKTKNDIFILNRIFSPLFQISYRTRGGYSEEFSTQKIVIMMEEKDYVSPKTQTNKSRRDNNSQTELGL